MSGSIIIDVAGRDAPWLVMVHGMSHDHRFFSAQIPHFESSYRIALIDLPGHGLAAATPGPFGPEEYSAGVQSALDAAGVDGLHYWGTHTGAGIGLLLAARQPDRFRSLVLEGPVIPAAPPPYVARRLESARNAARNHGIEFALNDWWEQSAWFDVMRAHPVRCRAAENREMVMAFGGAPWLDDTPATPLSFEIRQLSAIVAPVLLFNGEHDHPEFIDASKKLETVLPDVRRVEISDAGGFPTWEFPDRVNGEVERFLRFADRPT